MQKISANIENSICQESLTTCPESLSVHCWFRINTQRACVRDLASMVGTRRSASNINILAEVVAIFLCLSPNACYIPRYFVVLETQRPQLPYSIQYTRSIYRPNYVILSAQVSVARQRIRSIDVRTRVHFYHVTMHKDVYFMLLPNDPIHPNMKWLYANRYSFNRFCQQTNNLFILPISFGWQIFDPEIPSRPREWVI